MDSTSPRNWGWDSLSRIFHVGTQISHKLSDQGEQEADYSGYLEFCSSIVDKVPNLTTSRGEGCINLPQPRWDSIRQLSVAEGLCQRYTCRNFCGKSVSLEQLSDALWATFGAIHGFGKSEYEEAGLKTLGYRRSSPSGGCLQTSEPYLVALNVEDLAPGIYHYRSHEHTLGLIHENLKTKDLTRLLCGQSCVEGLAYGVFITSRFDKMWWKYPHSRAYRVALMDIGCLAQTFQLVSTAQGFQSWLTGYFMDKQVNNLLGLNDDLESSMFFLGAGRGHGAIARGMIDALRKFNINRK
jgi:SagB-type dehydrogenase family enzyme